MEQKRIIDRVFKEVKKIPKGKTKSYKEISKAVKTSPRIVARILSQNLHPIKIPCHRVIRNDGKPGGYTFEGKRKDKFKIKLLKEEGVKIENNKVIC